MAIDYSNPEILHIQTAVRTMVERVVTRVNERGRFKIPRIVPCGSMAEQTAVLKFNYEEGMYTEFDFLANLDYSPNIICRDHHCRQCVEVSEFPVSVGAMSELQEFDKFSHLGTAPRCDHLFWREVNTCLGSDIHCFSVQYNDKPNFPSHSYKLAAECESDYRCEKCVVEMPTGILRVNHSVSVGRRRGHANCSLAFMWTSKANTLSVYDELLQKKARQVTSLPVHVDFLPALEVLKAEPDEAVHDFFFVPKNCNSCGYGVDKWRKSNCLAEIAYIVNEMSVKHRKCYKIIKYFLSTIGRGTRDMGIRFNLNGYHVKIVTLNHSRKCSDSSEGCAECVLGILTELKHGYETKTLTSLQESGVNIFRQTYIGPDHIESMQKAIKRLCSATDIVQLMKLV